MMDQATITLIAKRLYEAEKNRAQIDLLSLQYPSLDMDGAYRIQDALVVHKINQGRHKIGWKIGLTSKAMQYALNIDIPDSGVLLDDMLFENGTIIPKGHFIQPRIEAEIAFIMKSDLGTENITPENILDATDYVAPALEILDTRILRKDPKSGKTRNVCDTISDNAANAGIVLGKERFDPKTIDLGWVGAIVKKNNAVEGTGLGAGVLGNPLTSMVWLARRMHHYGQSITAGDVILSGSFISPIEADSGSDFYADFGNFGSVTISFT